MWEGGSEMAGDESAVGGSRWGFSMRALAGKSVRSRFAVGV